MSEKEKMLQAVALVCNMLLILSIYKLRENFISGNESPEKYIFLSAFMLIILMKVTKKDEGIRYH